MKNVKIGIFVGFIVLIGFIILKMGGEGIGSLGGPDSTEISKELISSIQSKIDSLKKEPENKLSQEFYTKIKSDITAAAKAGKLGSNEQENKKNKEILEKNLYSVYAEKFVAQAMYIFKRSEWKQTDILQIRSGVKDLSASPYLKRGPVDNSFTTIKGIITKHDEITAFVNSCKGFTVSPDQPEARFPDVTDKLTRAQQYLAGNLENPFVNNCQRLKEELTNVPKFLADNNYNYLFRKIEIRGGRYTELSQTEYREGPQKKLRPEIDSFKRTFLEYSRANDLFGKLDAIENLARGFYNNKK
jgi:hypothetical protein